MPPIKALQWLGLGLGCLSLLWMILPGLAGGESVRFQRMTLRAPPFIQGLATITCGGKKEVVALGKEGQRYRVTLSTQGPGLSALGDCKLPAVPPDPERLPDGEVSPGRADMAWAWLAEPTERYRHGILGDGIEAGALRVVRHASGGKEGLRLTLRLDEGHVFEDRRARIVDLDGDGRSEVLVIRSGLEDGGALALYGIRDGVLVTLASSAAFGRPHRWLNVVGVEDFDGDGRREVAAVLTPHIGGTLALYEWRGGRLVLDHERDGFSNHAIGSRELDMSAVADVDGDGIPDLVVPDANRRVVRMVTFAGGHFHEWARVDNPAEIVTGIHLVPLPGRSRAGLVYGLKTGVLVGLIPGE